MATDGVQPVVVILGRPSLAESEDQVAAAARILAGVPGVAFLSGLRRGNVNGALDMGMAPGVLPGRIGLDEGRAWYEHHWGSALPEKKGAGTAGILADASRGRIGALVLIGADPLSDFPDSTAALKGLLGARFMVAVDTHLTASARRADVILPAAAWAERRGTFTNIEGRISWLSQLVTDHGVAWPDWMIASELAARLGVDLGFATLEDIWAEIVTVSPLHQGVSYELLSGQQARDGVVVPMVGSPADVARPRPLDPMADPGIASAELHKIAPTALLVATVAMASEEEADPEVAAEGQGEEDGSPVPGEPPTLGLPSVPPPAVGSSSAHPGLLLVSRRTMWDGGTQVQANPSLAALHPDAALRVHPAVLAGVGTADGEKVKVSSSRGSVVVPAVGDPGMPRGSAVLTWNLPGTAAGDLIDAAQPVTEVTIESVATEGGDDQ
jgi:NADH-quinone oxidoreductase subunit G